MLNDDPRLSYIHHYHRKNHCGDDNSTVLVVLFPSLSHNNTAPITNRHPPSFLSLDGEQSVGFQGRWEHEKGNGIDIVLELIARPVYVRPVSCLSSRSMVPRGLVCCAVNMLYEHG